MAAPIVSRPESDGQPLSSFGVATVASLRLKQLMNGSRPRVEAAGHKLLHLAVLEVLAGLVSWDLSPATGDAGARERR
jgi:hypothetical protein